jgi:hypothetical protein
MVKLADQFGLSDVGLKKICRKNHIPVPYRGYWARKEAGQKPQKILLPKGFPDVVITINRNPLRDSDAPRRPPGPRNHKLVLRKVEKLVSLCTELGNPHPLIESAGKVFQSSTTDKNGLLEIWDQGCLDIRVSPGSLSRALAIMDTVIKTLEKLGNEVSVTEDGTTARFSNCPINFGITEGLRSRFITPQEHDLSGNYRFGHNIRSENRVPTGDLIITADPPSKTNLRKTWKDTESERLEGVLPSFIKGLISIAAHLNRKMPATPGEP